MNKNNNKEHSKMELDLWSVAVFRALECGCGDHRSEIFLLFLRQRQGHSDSC